MPIQMNNSAEKMKKTIQTIKNYLSKIPLHTLSFLVFILQEEKIQQGEAMLDGQ